MPLATAQSLGWNLSRTLVPPRYEWRLRAESSSAWQSPVR